MASQPVQPLGAEQLARRANNARAVIGRHRSGRSTTSKEHDAALEEAFGWR